MGFRQRFSNGNLKYNINQRKFNQYLLISILDLDPRGKCRLNANRHAGRAIPDKHFRSN